MENEMDLSIAGLSERSGNGKNRRKENACGNSMIPGSGLLIRWRR